MTWTTPSNVSSGTASSSQFNTETVANLIDLHDRLEAQRTSMARVYQGSSQTLTVASFVTVNYTVASTDVGSNFNLTTDTYTVPSTGVYSFTGRAGVAVPAANERFLIEVHANAVQLVRGTDITAANAGPVTFQVNGIRSLTAGDAITVKIQQVNGTARSLEAASGANYFAIQRIS